MLLHELVDDVEQDERALLTPARTRQHQLCIRREYQIKQIILNILKIGKCDIYVLCESNYFSYYYFIMTDELFTVLENYTREI